MSAAMPDDYPPDALLTLLYSRFSEDTLCADWRAGLELPENQRRFTLWLIDNALSAAPRRPLADYEEAALPILRDCWAKACGALAAD